jgi:hypothetical protein
MAQSHDATQSEPLRSSCPFLEEEAELAPLNAAQVLKEIDELMPNFESKASQLINYRRKEHLFRPVHLPFMGCKNHS